MTLLVRRTLVVAGAVVLISIATLAIARVPGAVPASSAPLAPLAAAPAAVPTELDADLGIDLDAVLAVDQSSAAPDAAGPRGQLRRLAAWRRLVHATVVVDLQQGGLTTIQLDHGTIAVVNATTLTITEAGGGSVTVALGKESRIRRAGAKATAADLKAADEVFVMSKVETGGTTAYLVVVPKK